MGTADCACNVLLLLIFFSYRVMAEKAAGIVGCPTDFSLEEAVGLRCSLLNGRFRTSMIAQTHALRVLYGVVPFQMRLVVFPVLQMTGCRYILHIILVCTLSDFR